MSDSPRMPDATSGPSASPEARRVASRRAQAAAPAFNPFERVYGADGSLDREYCSKRIPNLVDLLRNHPSCWPARIDVSRLGTLLLADDATPLREAPDQEGFEAALRTFSEHHLHELADETLLKTLHEGLAGIAKDEKAPRRDRAAAAIGIALLNVPPDAAGLRGRGVADLLLRVTMEEQTAQEQLRKKARETEGGLTNEELNAFWEQYPALRWRHQERYRREVGHVLSETEKGNLPIAISVDLALRGASALLGAVARAKAAGGGVEAQQAEQILRGPFVQDMLDGGADVVTERWRAEIAALGMEDGLRADERREALRLLETAVRLVEERGPGSDPILFYAYLRAVVQGHYYVRDQADLDAARPVFTESGISADGVLAYAAFLAGVDGAAKHRLLLAALELWPEHAGIRTAASAMGEAEAAAAAVSRLGPRYEDAETGEDVPDGVGGDGVDGEGVGADGPRA